MYRGSSSFPERASRGIEAEPAADPQPTEQIAD